LKRGNAVNSGLEGRKGPCLFTDAGCPCNWRTHRRFSARWGCALLRVRQFLRGSASAAGRFKLSQLGKAAIGGLVGGQRIALEPSITTEAIKVLAWVNGLSMRRDRRPAVPARGRGDRRGSWPSALGAQRSASPSDTEETISREWLMTPPRERLLTDHSAT